MAAGLPQVLADGTQYIYGAGLVSQVAASGTVYYLADGLGSTAAIVDSSGTVVQSYAYDVYGTVKTSSGSQASDVQFAGQQTDPNGLQYLRARYYDASTGRFLSRDPLHSGDPTRFPAYRYGSANPASNTDPSGLDTAPPGRPNTPPIDLGVLMPQGAPIGRCAVGTVCLPFFTPSGPVMVNFIPGQLYNPDEPEEHGKLIAAAVAAAQAVSDRLNDIASGRFGWSTGSPLQDWTIFVVDNDLGNIDHNCAGATGCTVFQNHTIWINVNAALYDVYGAMSHEIGHVVFGGAHCDWDSGGATHTCFPGPNGSRCTPTPGQGVVGPPPEIHCGQ